MSSLRTEKTCKHENDQYYTLARNQRRAYTAANKPKRMTDGILATKFLPPVVTVLTPPPLPRTVEHLDDPDLLSMVVAARTLVSPDTTGVVTGRTKVIAEPAYWTLDQRSIAIR